MTTTLRRYVLRANALYIFAFGWAGVLFDIRGILFGLGPQGRVLADAPHAGITFIEAHGLAIILSVLLWRAPAERPWHVTAFAMDALLGVCNLAFWQLFVATDALAVGYLSTGLHLTFATLNAAALRALATVPAPEA